MNLTNILNPIAKPIADVLAAFYAVIPNFGVAILLLSVVWMIIISPLTLKSTRSMLAMQALQPELNRLKEKHKNDRQAFAQAQMDLMRERNVSPFGACLPSILPLPVFIALFRVIDGLSHHAANGTPAPQYLNPHTAMYQAIQHAGGQINAFGVDLSKNALSHHSSVAAAIPYFVLLLVMMGTQYWQTSMMMNRNQAAQQNPQMKMMKYLPLVFGIICIRFPAGVILYYGMSNLCRILQQWAMYRYDPKVKTLVTQEVKEVEAKTREIDEEEDAERRNRRRQGGTTSGSGGKPGGGRAKPAEPPPSSGRSRLRELLAGPAAAGGTSGSPGGTAGTRAGSGTGNGSGKGASGTKGARPPAKDRPPATTKKSGGAPDSASKDRTRRKPSGDAEGAPRRKTPANRGNSSEGTGSDQQASRNGADSAANGAEGSGNANGAKPEAAPSQNGGKTPPARTGARTGASGGSSAGTGSTSKTAGTGGSGSGAGNRAVQPNKPSTGGRNIPARPNRSKRRRKGR